MGADGPGQVERAVENTGCAEALAGQSLASAGGGGDGDEMIGERGIEFADQAADSQDFADGDGVDPDERAAFSAFERWNAAQPVHEPLAVFLRGGQAEKPPRQTEQEAGEQSQVVEKQNHA